ncbi:nucleotidyltransferase domain-containing protein [Mariniphaga sp.]|uniref:nucleotidyltransferase domain-containing protein n=1 Tax=Mariniphaga sp. TaxID=1954475 RepID=UPI00356461EA
MNQKERTYIKKKLSESLSKEKEVSKIVVFGSFLNSKTPGDIDVAVFQNSEEKYLSLSLKYRKLTKLFHWTSFQSGKIRKEHFLMRLIRVK